VSAALDVSQSLEQQVAELARVRIEPGADPRAGWSKNETALPEELKMSLFECGKRDAPRFAYLDYRVGSGEPYGCRYVPTDVQHWRDPAHRAELMRRAREHAAIRPGVYR
jgi:hypothetical protein